MPTALETLVKILKLERKQGCKNTAVVGGLVAYSEQWKPQATEQARQPDHHALIAELVDLMQTYEANSNTAERFEEIGYMLDRIMGRKPTPEKYLESIPAEIAEAKPKPQPPPKQESQKPERSSNKRSDRNQNRNNQFSSNKQETFEDYENSPFAGNRHVKVEQDIQPMPTLARPPRKKHDEIDLGNALGILNRLQEPITTLKGIGAKLARLYEKIDIHTVNDMLHYFPRRYDDYTGMNYIARLEPNVLTTVIGTITSSQVRISNTGRKDFVITIADGSGSMTITFFGQHFLARTLKEDRQIVARGKTSIWRNQIQMSNPEWEFVDSDNLHTAGIVPIYPLTEGLRPRGFRRTMRQIVTEWAEQVPEYMPYATRERANLADIDWAIENIHFPAGWDHLHHAKRRFVFDELLILQLAVLAGRRDWQSVQGIELEVTDEFLDGFLQNAFPYELTGAQHRALMDIRRDVTTDIPMNRLIQGDVGSGKTAVAITAMAMAVENGKQAALMAPTSILAEQHYRTIYDIFNELPIEQKPVIALLTSALTTSERESIYRGLADGSIDIAIGTHALIQRGVEFNELAIAIIDEQHRFGVEQRGALRGKGTNPHLLVMTATPIPRTLALTLYADLDLSVIDEKPPGRQPVETKIIEPIARERSYSFVEGQLEQGRQAFLIHPLVEESETIDAVSAVEAYERLKQVFFRYNVCLLHGRMSATEKEEIMAAFAHGEYDVMVTTSVAEVGVDVPNASVIVIESANRFGLAQLHQFRGRVGRGEHQSFCLLIADTDSEDAMQRLSVMVETNDGFKLAEMDWKLRGSGDLVGTRQSGGNTLHFASEMTPELVSLAQREARTIYETDPDLSSPENTLLAQRVVMLHNDETDVS